MGMDWIYGIQPVLQVLKAGRRKSKEIQIHRTHKGEEIQEILSLASSQKISVRQVEKISIPHSSPDLLHQGVALLTEPYPYLDIQNLFQELQKKDSCLLLLLDQIQDPHNLGAILRTAHCAGVDAVLLPERGGALINATVLKTSAGAAEYLPIYLITNLARSIEELKEKSIWVYGAEGGEVRAYDDEKYPPKTAIVVGSEGKGLRHLIKEKCDLLISIPLLGRINSLNVSVATGILLYEVLRQRKNTTNTP